MGGAGVNVLVVDDEPDERALLAGVFARAGHTVTCAESVEAALAALKADPPPELILLDLLMPNVSGLSLLVQLRQSARTARVPVIVVSAQHDFDQRVVSLMAGADDYVTKPVNAAELLVRAKKLLRVSSELASLHRSSFLEPLTGLLNRLGLDHLLGLQVELALRHRTPLAVLFLDLDGLQRINTTCGHAIGDRVLCDVARALGAQLRGSDFAARWGGDDFVVVLPGADPQIAAGVSTRLQAAILSLSTPAEPTLGVSIGIASLFDDVAAGEDTPRRLVLHACEAVDRKQRVRGLVPPPLPPSPRPPRRASGSRRERRRDWRVAVDGSAIGRSQGGWRAGVRDLSLTGALLTGAAPLNIGEPVQAAIRVNGHPRLSISGTVVRQGMNDLGQACHGIHFGKTSTAGEDRIEDIIAGVLEHADGDAVLLVDPLRAERRALALELRNGGTRVVSAHTALDAVTILEGDEVQVGTLLVTADLTQTTGVELAGYAAEEHPTIHRVLLSRGDGTAARAALARGDVHAVLEPPWTIERMLAALAR